MCGICGVVGSETPADIEAMIQTLYHRGPDYQGTWKEKNVKLGHARLSIQDLNYRANQPMISHCERYVIVYNGEIYNFELLRNELQQLGVEFRTQSDTEVVLEGFARWGQSFFEKLNGMFSFAIYDRNERKIVIVRDRFGIKPLYYCSVSEGFVFGSEIKSILASSMVPKEIDFQGLHEYLLFSTTLGESTFYKKIKKLEPGNYIELDCQSNAFRVAPFKLNYDLPSINDGIESSIIKIRDLFERSVQSQLVADVPIGVFLSGGVDSTAITAIASKHYRGKLKTFSAGFDFDKGVNELPNARFVSKHYSTEHHEFNIKGNDIPQVLSELNDFFDQPFGDAANIPLYLMSRELKGEHKVILQGDGGDELFAGYGRYSRIKHQSLFRILSKIAVNVSPLIPSSSKYYRKLRSMYAVAQDKPELVAALLYSQEMINEPPHMLFKDDWREKLLNVDPYYRHKRLHEKFKHLDLLQEVLYTDVNVILPDQYLEKVDRATMANSLEVRVPFLDNELAEYVMALPSKYKVRGKEKKYLLKKAFEGLVPNKILYGPKRGFGVPFSYWLKTSMKDFMIDTVQSSDCYTDDVKKMMTEHISGKRNHGFILWKILNLSMWLQKNG